MYYSWILNLKEKFCFPFLCQKLYIILYVRNGLPCQHVFQAHFNLNCQFWWSFLYTKRKSLARDGIAHNISFCILQKTENELKKKNLLYGKSVNFICIYFFEQTIAIRFWVFSKFLTLKSLEIFLNQCNKEQEEEVKKKREL